MTADELEERFTAYLTRDDDAVIGCHFFEILAEIERRREQETIEVSLRVVNGQARFEPSDQTRAQGNTLWVGDKRLVVKLVE